MAKFCVLNLQKYKAGDLGGLRNHVERMGKCRTNNDIDPELTKYNHDYDGLNARKLIADTNKRIAELDFKKAVRKDAVVCIGGIISASPEKMNSMSREEQEQYFRDAVDFIKKEFGAENIRYAKAHFDETESGGVPHLHFGVTPVLDGRLCAKKIMTPTKLKSLQTRFWEEVGRNHGMDRGVEDSGKKHLSENDYKRKQNEQKAKELAGREAELVQRENFVREYGRRVAYAEKILGGLVGEVETVGRFLPLIADAPRIAKHINGMAGQNKRARYRKAYAGAVAEIATALKNVVDDAKECNVPVPAELGKSEDFPKCWALLTEFEREELETKAMLRDEI